MSEWKEVRLGDVCEFNPDNLNKRNYKHKNILYLDTSSVTENVFTNFQKIDIREAPSRAKRLVKNKDIIFSSVRPNQKHYGFIEKSEDNLVISTGFIVIRTLSQVPKFIYYYLIQQQIIDKLQQVAEQRVSTYPSITYEDISNLTIHLPPLPIQKKIADILSVIDEKIETLQNINSTLEEMAKAIFKSWFVDFDITKAKASGKSNDEIAKELGINKEIIQLFPSEFETSEIGEIPKGWEIRKINEISNIGIGKTPPRKEKECFTINKNDIKWVSIKDMGNSNMYIFNTNEYLTKEAIKKYNIRIVPKNSVLLSFKLTLGRVSITSEEMVTNEAIAHFVIDNNSIISTEYIYLYLKTFNFDKLGNTSSIARAVNSKVVKNIRILISDNIIIKTFNKIINPIFQNIENNTQQIQTLQKTRDTLLPKLINGEIEVDELDIRGIE